jgi:hypothetical protein
VPDIGQHIEKVIVLVIAASFLPAVISWWRSRGKAPKGTNPPEAPAVTPADAGSPPERQVS